MRPNVIVFFTDQQRFDTTGVHGNPLGLTPNFDQLAARGTHVTHAFTPQPVCGPSRACMQTGTYATTNGCFRNGISLPENKVTLAQHFKNAGYETAYIGKWHLADSEKYVGAVPEEARGGYDTWLAANLLEFVSDAYDLRLFDSDNAEVKLPGYRVDAQTDAAIRYLAQKREQPFFLFLSFLEPHHQNHRDDYPAPEGYSERYTGRWTPPDLAALGGSSPQHLGGYYGMVKRLDEALGRLLEALKSLGQLGNTVIAVTSDHGCHFKTRNDEYKRSCHEASVRVPLALQGPGFDGGGQVKELVSLLDLPPTLLDAAGCDVPADMQGRSLLPLVQKQPVAWPDDVLIQISESEVGRAVRTNRWKYGVVAPDADPWDDMNAERYLETYLYDLLADPYELRNLVGLDTHRHVADVLQKRLKKRMVEAGEQAPEIEVAPPRKGNAQLNVSALEAES